MSQRKRLAPRSLLCFDLRLDSAYALCGGTCLIMRRQIAEIESVCQRHSRVWSACEESTLTFRSRDQIGVAIRATRSAEEAPSPDEDMLAPARSFTSRVGSNSELGLDLADALCRDYKIRRQCRRLLTTWIAERHEPLSCANHLMQRCAAVILRVRLTLRPRVGPCTCCKISIIDLSAHYGSASARARILNLMAAWRLSTR